MFFFRQRPKGESFARSRINSLLTTQAFGAVGALASTVIDMVVSGNVIGVDALAAIAAVTPVVIAGNFLSKLTYCGAGYLYAKRQGEFDHEKARKIVGLSIEFAVAIGVVMFITIMFGRDFYLDMMGIGGSIREQAVAYWGWMAVNIAITPLVILMWRLVYADGELVTTAVADAITPPINIALSVFFAKLTGTAAGAAQGTLATTLITEAVMLLHLFRKSNGLKPKWNFSFADLKELLSYSLTDSSTQLCQCAFVAIVNWLVVYSSSAKFLPAVSMVLLVLELRDILDKIGDAYMPIAEMYFGEKNYPRMRELARYSLVVAAIAGVVVMVLVIAFAPLIVTGYGIPKGEVFEHAMLALKICAISLPFSSAMAFMRSHYLTLGRISLSVVETFSEEFLLTGLCTLTLCYFWGLDAIWVGLPVGGVFTLVVMIGYSWWCDRHTFPMLIPVDDPQVRVFNLAFVPGVKRIMEVRAEVERFLDDNLVPKDVVMRVMLLVEECAMMLLDKNKMAAKGLIAEGSFMVSRDSTQVVFRDTGRISDITDNDAKVDGLRSFVVSGLMQAYSNRCYLSTIGCNRASFVFSHHP